MPTQIPSPSQDHSLIRILIADDMAQVRQDLRLLLELTGKLEVIGEAGNGLEAMQLAKILQPEVILMDLAMPVLDGYEAARQIKSFHPTCRIVALTAHDYPEARQKASQAGIDAFIAKGAPLEYLVEVIIEGK
jgi:DNA-binding NarL/FixJ family response regulator